MRKLAAYITIAMAAIGCTPKIFEGMGAVAKEAAAKESLYPFFSGTTEMTHVFNMQLSYKENDVDGFLIVKHSKDSSARAVFTSIPGMTIFDFEISATEFKVHRCIEPMQKRAVLNLFENDFRTLLLYNVPLSFKSKIYKNGSGKVGHRIKTRNGKTYFLTDTTQKQLQEVRVPGLFTLLAIDYKDFEGDFPKHISISHPRLKLSMRLEKAK